MKKVTVSVGIVAYNEEKNIREILQDIVRQKEDFWELGHIYLSCGGCTDNTVSYARSLNIPNLIIFENPKREGKATDEQKIFNAMTDDVLVLFDADVRLQGDSVIHDLIEPFRDDPSITETGGNARPYKPTTFFENAVYSTFRTLDLSRRYVHGGNNIYGASGQCLALRKNMVKKIRFPASVIAEDDYIFFTNKKLGGKFKYVPHAIVWYKLPKTFSDYFRQTQRSDTAPSIGNVENYFGHNLVRDEYYRPPLFYAWIVGQSFFKNPVGTFFMIIVRIYARIMLLFTKNSYRLDWYTATSTK